MINGFPYRKMYKSILGILRTKFFFRNILKLGKNDIKLLYFQVLRSYLYNSLLFI